MSAKSKVVKILKYLGAICLLFISFIFVMFSYLDVKQEGLDNVAIPYLNTALNDIFTWNPDNLKSHLTPEAVEAMGEEGIVNYIDILSNLGDVKKIEPIQYHSGTFGATVKEGSMAVAIYTTKAMFENGEADISIRLLRKEKEIGIQHIQINSEKLVEILASNKQVQNDGTPAAPASDL